jgi:hypothetical protein
MRPLIMGAAPRFFQMMARRAAQARLQWRPGPDMKLSSIVLIAAAGVCAAPALGQNPGRQETRSYSYGIGRIAWTFPEGLAADFAVPQWSAGARVECNGKGLRCELQANTRDISQSDEDRRGDLRQAMRLRIPKPAKQALNVQTYGASAGVVYITLEDSRRGEHFRYLTLGYAYKGVAVLSFEASANKLADIGPVLALVDGARPVDALEMWALRLRDYRAVCEERFPAYKEANDRAFAASPFAAAGLGQESVKAAPEPANVVAIARQRLMDFAAAFDGSPLERRRSFCEGFATWVAEAAKGL